MIRYEMHNDDDGLNGVLALINDSNNSRIIVTDDQLRELSSLVYKILALTDMQDIRDEVQS